MKHTLLAAAVALALSAATREADAFCRSTSCRTTASKECATDANECPIDGAKLFWTSSCISYAMNELGTQDLDPEETRAIIRKTFQAWTEVPCGPQGAASMTFQERDPVSCKVSEFNKSGPNVNVILFQDNDWHYRGIDGTLAKTSVTYNDETGEIYDADIEVNAANNTLTTTDDPKKVEYDLQAILTHEVGHFIGVAHSSDPNAVMAPSYAPGSLEQRVLTKDDVNAVCAIYPPNRDAVCNVEPHGGFSATCSKKAPTACSAADPARRDEEPSSMLWFGVLGLGACLVTARRLRHTSAGGLR
jgi:hypothetical protein